MYGNQLCHWGIKGMHWGIRRFQNLDGTLTEAGKARYHANSVSEMEKEGYKKYQSDIQAQQSIYREAGNVTRNAGDIARRAANRKSVKIEKEVKDMSDAELRAKINRIQMERTYASLTASEKRSGSEIASRVLETTGSVVGIAGGTLGIVLAINQLKG